MGLVGVNSIYCPSLLVTTGYLIGRERRGIKYLDRRKGTYAEQAKEPEQMKPMGFLNGLHAVCRYICTTNMHG